jgi:uncharacterized membrane protein
MNPQALPPPDAASPGKRKLSCAQWLAVSLFAIGMTGIGFLSVLSRDFAYDWQPVPRLFPGRDVLAVICGAFMITVSAALMFRRSAPFAARTVLLFLIAWLCLKVPAVISAPQIEGVWIGFGEIGMLLGGGWAIFARMAGFDEGSVLSLIAGDSGIRIARTIFGLAVIPVGLGHIFYVGITASLIPAWMPFRVGLAYLTGIGQIACGLGLLFSVMPRAAAFIEAGMVALFALLVWGPDSWLASTPKLAGTPAGPRFALTAFFITWAVGASALLIGTTLATARRKPQPIGAKSFW